jgi:amino acid adenylation domain-containing protein
MSSLVVPAQRGLGAVGIEYPSTRVGEDSYILYFILPDYLSCLVATTVAAQGLQASLLLFTVFQEVLRRYAGQKSVAVSFAQNGAASRIIVLEGNRSLRELLQRREEPTGDVGNIELPGVVIEGQFSFQSADGSSDGPHPFANTSGMHCSLQSFPEGMTGFIEFQPNLWDLAAVTHFVSSYRNLLSSALADLDSPIGQLNILTDADVETFDTWNATGDFYPRARVDELFDLRVTEKPDDTAVTFLDRNISYGSLSDETKQLAARLQSLGVQPGTLVGICMGRCVEMVAALLAIFRTGAAYLPLDPAFPQDRLDFMQQDARPLVVITQSHLRERCSFHAAHVLCIDLATSQSEVSSLAEYFPPQASSLDDVAYVLYTSGSTGKPKGVQITHRALTNMLIAVSNDLSLHRSDVLLATSTISFDISTFEIFAPLIAGAHLIVAPRAIAVNGELLANAIRESGATLLQATPAGWQVLLEAGWAGQAGLKMLTVGEPLTWILAQRLLQRGAGLWNLYGPTEVTVYATGRQIYRDDKKITVGRPLANYTAYVLDQHHQRLPIGAIGELFLGGIGVGAGYLNRPELTIERFLTDPFSSAPEARLYRTGDLARLLPNGEIDLLGRADNQVKLRGYRIELEEIEALLDTHPAIAKSLARVTDLGDGDQCLVAYVVPRDRNLVNEADWRQHALRSLPAYMVPTSFIVMESFPLTPNGKVDRKALPAFQLAKPLEFEPSSDTTDDSMERTVLHCWRRVLGRPDLGLDHDFFAAGGHSLLVMRAFAHMNEKLGCKLPISLLVEAPTARRFAELVTQTKDAPAKYLVSMQPEGTLPPLYLIHHLLGDVLIYRHVANHFAPHRPVFGIQPPVDLINRPQPYSLQDLASNYVGEILKRQTGGLVHLAGFSSGSIIAFEMARQLKNLGFEVGLLALIDGDVQVEGPPIPAPVKYAKIAIRKLCKVVFKMRDEVADGPAAVGGSVRFSVS